MDHIQTKQLSIPGIPPSSDLSNSIELILADWTHLLGSTYPLEQNIDELTSLRSYLATEIHALASKPVKHVRLPHREVLIYWDTWGLTISHGRWVYLGLYSWMLQDETHAFPYDLKENKDSAYLVSKISDNYSSIAHFRAWLEVILKRWGGICQSPVACQIAHDSQLVKRIADALSKQFDERFALSSILASYLDCHGDKKEICGLAAITPKLVEVSRLLVSATQLPFECSPAEYKLSLLYSKLQNILRTAGMSSDLIENGKVLLKRFNVSQNARERLLRLEIDEIACLCTKFPLTLGDGLSYMSETARTLQRMQSIYQRFPVGGRPKLTWDVALLTSKLSRLRRPDSSTTVMSKQQFRSLVRAISEYKSSSVQEEEPVGFGNSIQISSVIVFIELYLDELMMPVELDITNPIDEYTAHELCDESIKYYCEEFNISHEELAEITTPRITVRRPEITTTADWYIAENPKLTKQQIKLGWRGIQKRALEWHQNHKWGTSDEYEYREWRCPIQSNQDEWLASLPEDMELVFVPLTNSVELLNESETMDHCVVTYIESCASGCSRIFSIREKASGKTIATAEFTAIASRWALVQLKGPKNIEMINRMYSHDDPIGILISKALDWYNKPYVHIPPKARKLISRLHV